MKAHHALLTALLAGAVACGGQDDGKTRGNIAKAFENSADPEANAKKASEDMKRLKERTAAKQEAAIREAIDAVTVAPPAAGVDLKRACAGMREAYDQFVQRRIQHDKTELDRWNVFKAMDLDKAEAECLDHKSVEVALCQQHAFENASREVTRSRAGEILNRCIDKYGNQLGALQPQAGAVTPS
ncbi:MAG: hypothetical protein KC420_17165 [Myxococcales bacterium]|nr:hypothetical protein [Myxococcales bacterium]